MWDPNLTVIVSRMRRSLQAAIGIWPCFALCEAESSRVEAGRLSSGQDKHELRKYRPASGNLVILTVSSFLPSRRQPVLPITSRK